MAREYARVGNIYLTDSTLLHAKHVAEKMRPHDIRECAIHMLSPIEALTIPLETEGTKNYTVMHNDTPIGMCGTVATEDNQARVWLLGTTDIDANYFNFAKSSRVGVEFLQGTYDLIENYVPIDHHHTIMWLAWSGFVVLDERLILNGHELLRFVRCNSVQFSVYNTSNRPVIH